MDRTERLGRVVNTPALYSSGSGFESRLLSISSFTYYPFVRRNIAWVTEKSAVK
jgi:hypothetical protein